MELIVQSRQADLGVDWDKADRRLNRLGVQGRQVGKETAGKTGGRTDRQGDGQGTEGVRRDQETQQTGTNKDSSGAGKT